MRSMVDLLHVFRVVNRLPLHVFRVSRPIHVLHITSRHRATRNGELRCASRPDKPSTPSFLSATGSSSASFIAGLSCKSPSPSICPRPKPVPSYAASRLRGVCSSSASRARTHPVTRADSLPRRASQSTTSTAANGCRAGSVSWRFSKNGSWFTTLSSPTALDPSSGATTTVAWRRDAPLASTSRCITCITEGGVATTRPRISSCFVRFTICRVSTVAWPACAAAPRSTSSGSSAPMSSASGIETNGGSRRPQILAGDGCAVCGVLEAVSALIAGML